MAKLTGYPPFVTIDGNDIAAIGVDVDDPTDDPSGSSKTMTFEQLLDYIRPVLILAADDTTTQSPPGTDSPIQVKFGAAQGGGGDPVQVDANGLITVNEERWLELTGTFSIARTSGSQVAHVYLRLLVNGVQQGPPICAMMEDADDTTPLQLSLSQVFSAGDTIAVEFVRDSAGHNSGELAINTSSIGWGVAPSASLRVRG